MAHGAHAHFAKQFIVNHPDEHVESNFVFFECRGVLREPETV